MIGLKTVGTTVATSYMIVDEEFEKLVIQVAATLYKAKSVFVNSQEDCNIATEVAFRLCDTVRREGEKRAIIASEVEKKRREFGSAAGRRFRS